MTRINLAGLLLIAALAATAHGQGALSTSGTYVVGSCKPNVSGYTTISAALAATPAPTTVQVCPGTYNEQILISNPVILEGITSAGLDQAIVAVPSGGLVTNTTGLFGPIAAQLWVDNVVGTVNVSDLTFDATGNGVSTAVVVGILYQNSTGTVNHVTTRYQMGGNGGYGVSIAGGASNPSVTVENSSIHDFDATGISADGLPSLTMTIKSNYMNATASSSGGGVVYDRGATGAVTGNSIIGGVYGIQPYIGAAGSISGNTIVNSVFGILVADAVTISSNKILNSSNAGISIFPRGAGLATIHNNTIIGGAAGIDFRCLSDENVHSNTMTDVVTGILDVPDAISSTNSYYNVVTIRTGLCDESKHSAAAGK